MKRAIGSVCLAAFLAFGGPIGIETVLGPGKAAAVAAEAKSKSKAGTRTKAGQRTCTAKTNAGETKTWQCPANQACCINRFMDQYVCGIPGLGCI